MNIGLERLPSASNYLNWLRDLSEPYLGSSCLELGSGLGELTEMISVGRTVTASDVSEHNLGVLRERFANTDNVTVQRIDASKDPLGSGYDSIVMMNVLEHIEDDHGTVQSLRDALAPGGHLVIYVPAFMALYSAFDAEIGHFRRYRKRELCNIVDEAGLRAVDARYVNSVGAVGWFVVCRLLKRPSSDQLTISTFDRVIVPPVRAIESHVRPPFGLSLLVVAQRR